MNSSGEEMIVRTRKPYTITKQRERWTPAEHNRFLEALKLYGRAWQRIEEHIGTKSAVQIRSHAQKFFSKLEKEANVKGVPVEEAHEISIPPPRPKRKPCNPYPRKTCFGVLSGKDFLDSPGMPKKHDMTNVDSSMKELGDDDDKVSPTTNTCFESGPPDAFMLVHSQTIDLNRDHGDIHLKYDDPMTAILENPPDHGKPTGEHDSIQAKEFSNVNVPPQCQKTSSTSFPRHVPVHIVEVNSTKSGVTHDYNRSNSESHMGTSESVPNYAPSVFPMWGPPSNPVYLNADMSRTAQRNINPTFLSYILSSLLQSPAAHSAAVSMAALCWPGFVDAKAIPQEILRLNSNTTQNAELYPNLYAVAAATVAAASAWWAAHGLLPFCHPPIGFPITPAPSTTVPVADHALHASEEGRKEDTKSQTTLKHELSSTVCAGSTVLPSPSSDADGVLENCITEGEATNLMNLLPASNLNEFSKMKTNKQQDRSSCGSNTSGSEVDTDVNGVKGELNSLPPDSEIPCKQRTKSIGSIHDSWKEVSEEGRLAFQALFSREVLPQKFSPLQSPTAKLQGNGIHAENLANEGASAALSSVKFQSRLTGFEPYKRCSVEAKADLLMMMDEGGKGPKRIRIEGETHKGI